jgi:hypothetical protein
VVELERELRTVGEGLPEGADDTSLEATAAEAELYEAEFVLPVSEAEARAARAAAEEAAEEAAAEAEGLAEEERAAAEAAAKAAAAKKKKKGGGGGSKKKGGGGGGGGKGGKPGGGGPAAESEWGADDEAQQLGPKLLLGSGRVRRKGAPPAAATAGVKAEAMEVDGAQAAAGGEGGEGGEDVTKLVAPLEELDDSGGCRVGGWVGRCGRGCVSWLRPFRGHRSGWQPVNRAVVASKA